MAKHFIPIASGKGGVGKSTVSVNLALALTRLGARVGLMDADVYGPSIPTMLGLTAQPGVDAQRRLTPLTVHGLQVISMGLLMKPGEATIWRGPMLHKTMEQFLKGVAWGDLDYLLVDLPPGTGDVQLSLCQLISITGAVIVSTPQDVALNVAQRAIAMFAKVKAPVLGIVENMSYYLCPHCGQREEIFGSGGARQTAEQLHVPFLGEIPLITAIRETSDAGTPLVVAAPDSVGTQAFVAIAEELVRQVHQQAGAGALAPTEISRTNASHIKIVWQDGHESMYPARELRLQCPCAGCVDEMTGHVRLVATSVPADVQPVKMDVAGRYGVAIVWSDGHRTGIYAFDRLRAMCPCKACEVRR